jgi:hypothetical protein
MQIENKVVEEFRRLLERETFEKSLDLSPGVRIRAISQQSNYLKLNVLDEIKERPKKDIVGSQKEKIIHDGSKEVPNILLRNGPSYMIYMRKKEKNTSSNGKYML